MDLAQHADRLAGMRADIDAVLVRALSEPARRRRDLIDALSQSRRAAGGT